MPQPKNQKSRSQPRFVGRFLVVLPGTDPLVWCRILVPEAYTFWDLHVAIQDAMGWMDSHQHEFEIVDPRVPIERVGIPLDDLEDIRPTAAGWEVPISKALVHGMGPMRYRSDVGDDWPRSLERAGVEAADGGRYPRCLAGAGACPPEDVGGTRGNADFLQTTRNPDHPGHQETVTWAGGTFDPSAFDPASLRFDDPRKRWRTAFREG